MAIQMTLHSIKRITAITASVAMEHFHYVQDQDRCQTDLENNARDLSLVIKFHFFSEYNASFEKFNRGAKF
jgi:hypothetical protein